MCLLLLCEENSFYALKQSFQIKLLCLINTAKICDAFKVFSCSVETELRAKISKENKASGVSSKVTFFHFPRCKPEAFSCDSIYNSPHILPRFLDLTICFLFHFIAES